jgi:23S rRNA pseudouridine1911/1915/1917 synthase
VTTSQFRFQGPQKKRRLDVCLAEGVENLSRSAAQRLVRAGAVSVNGEIEIRPSHTILPGADIRVEFPEPENESEMIASNQSFTVIYEDEHILVVDKPIGIPVHPGPGHNSDTLVNGLLFDFPEIREVGERERPGIVHRIDRDTSGLMVVARTKAAYEKLSEMIRERQVRRVYTALVRGGTETDEGLIDAPLGRDPRNRQRQAIVEHGREARTRFRVLERLARTTLMELVLETGRTHQIRIHLLSIGNPVVGDGMYGRAARGPGGLSRQFLHASSLAFKHPITGDTLQLDSPLPEDLQTSLDAARRE